MQKLNKVFINFDDKIVLLEIFDRQNLMIRIRDEAYRALDSEIYVGMVFYLVIHWFRYLPQGYFIKVET